MIRIHKENPELKSGSLKYVINNYNFIGYGRFTKDEVSVIIVNNNDHQVTEEITIWQLGIPREAMLKKLIITDENGFRTDDGELPVFGGKIQLTLQKTSAVVLKYSRLSVESFFDIWDTKRHA